MHEKLKKKKKKKKKKCGIAEQSSIDFKYRGGIAYLYSLAVLHLLNRCPMLFIFYYELSFSLFATMLIHIGEKLYIHTFDEEVW